jgi:hypothetical protein
VNLCLAERTSMTKSKSSLFDSTEVTHAVVARAVEAALAAVLAQQQPQKKPQPRKVERRVAKAAAGPPKRPRSKRGFRGTPPPLADVSLAGLPDDQLLTEYEVAAIARFSTNSLGTWRKRPEHPLRWTVIGGGRVRYRAGDVREFLASGYRPQPGRPRKKANDAALAPRRRVARPRAKADVAAPREAPQ